MIFRGRVTLSCRRCTFALVRGGERAGKGAVGEGGGGEKGSGAKGKGMCCISRE